MRIDGTHAMEAHKAAEDREAKNAAPQGRPAGPAPVGGAEVISSQERLIAAASAAEEVNTRAVEEARALLQSGQWDSPEAARRAAQAILDLGL